MLVLFLLFPLAGFIYSLRDLTKRQCAAIFILFYGLFGYCQHFQIETSDIYRKGCQFEEVDLMNDIIADYEEGETPDLYNILMCYIIRPFTSNPKVYIGILGLIFGVLCYNFYKYIYINWTPPKRGLFYILLLLALSNISLVTFTGIRSATASILFLCAIYRYIYLDKKVWLAGILLSLLIHFQMWSVIIVFVIYLLLPQFSLKWTRLFKIALLASFAISLIDLSGNFNALVEDNSDDIYNASIANKADRYTNGEEIIHHNDSNTLYRQANQAFFNAFAYINRFGIMVVMWLMINYMKTHRPGRSERKMYLFLLLFAIAVISFYSINYDLGFRISNIWWELFYVFFARLYSLDHTIKAKHLLSFIVFVNLANIAYFFVNAPRLVELSFWWYPVPLSIIKGWNFSITPIPFF